MKTTEELKRLIQEVAEESAIKKAEASAPWIRWPVVNAIFRTIVAKVSDIIFGELIAHVDFVWIDSNTAEERKAYEQATSELGAQLGNPDAKEEDVAIAKENFKNTLRDLIRLSNERMRAG